MIDSYVLTFYLGKKKERKKKLFCFKVRTRQKNKMISIDLIKKKKKNTCGHMHGGHEKLKYKGNIHRQNWLNLPSERVKTRIGRPNYGLSRIYRRSLASTPASKRKSATSFIFPVMEDVEDVRGSLGIPKLQYYIPPLTVPLSSVSGEDRL